MNWGAIGAAGELIGAVGVIASPVFLAFQIRQNSNSLWANSDQLEQYHHSDRYPERFRCSLISPRTSSSPT
jgi:hypothetical protein